MACPVQAGPDQPVPVLHYAVPVQRMPMPMSRLRALVEIVLLIPAGMMGATVSYLVVSTWSLSDPRWEGVADSLGLGMGCVLACGLFLYLAGHKPRTVGWTGRRWLADVGLGLAALLATYIVLIQATLVILLLRPDLLAEPSPAQRAIEETFPPMPLSVMVPVCLFVAFWEELVFRGFLLTRLQAVLRRWWLTVPMGAAIFGAPHVYQGTLAIVITAFLGLVMGLLFVWRKSLVAPIAFHLVHNVLIFQMLRSVSSTWE